jgi:hypothetical protein
MPTNQEAALVTPVVECTQHFSVSLWSGLWRRKATASLLQLIDHDDPFVDVTSVMQSQSLGKVVVGQCPSLSNAEILDVALSLPGRVTT